MPIEILSVPIKSMEELYSQWGCTPEQIREWELGQIATGLPLPPLDLLPEGSLLREEWFRRRRAAEEDSAKSS